MSLAFGLVTALLERSCSGSEVAQRFDHSIGYFWPATHQQLYRELSRMERDGWVASQPIEAAPGRKRVYHVLPKGRAAFGEWVPDRPLPWFDDIRKLAALQILAGPVRSRRSK